MPRLRNGGTAIGGAANGTFVVKDWIAISIAAFSLIFSAGGWYFKIGELEKQVSVLQVDYVRKDVLGAQLTDIQRQLADQSTAIEKLSVKLDGVNIAVSGKK